MTRVMLSCGEPSGDLYAAALIDRLRQIEPSLDVFGFGGERTAAAGADLVGDFRGLSVTGLVEALSVLRQSWAMLRRLEAAARSRRPDVFVAIDFPDFNFRLLPIMRRLGVPIVYYISPQLWAWRPGRMKTIRANVDRMLVIFPFEQRLYEDAGVPVEFVGHPLIELIPEAADRGSVLGEAGLDASRPVIALLPGSRANEIRHNLPGIVAGARLAAERVPGVQCVVARAPSLEDALFSPLQDLRAARIPVAILTGQTDRVLDASDVVVTASGTATVQTALHQKPMVIVYRVAPLTYAMGKRFVRVSSYGMVNLVASRRIVNELIQEQFTPEALADETVSLLTDRGRVAAMRSDLTDVVARLGSPGASRRAAEAVLAVARVAKHRAGNMKE
jgi:lipid-A-disaccharide synthase